MYDVNDLISAISDKIAYEIENEEYDFVRGANYSVAIKNLTYLFAPFKFPDMPVIIPDRDGIITLIWKDNSEETAVTHCIVSSGEENSEQELKDTGILIRYNDRENEWFNYPHKEGLPSLVVETLYMEEADV